MEKNEIDYKSVFESVFNGAHEDEIGCILRSTDVPFSYCERALKEKYLKWKNKLKIALREDCPEKILVKLCKAGGERFRSRILIEREHIPESALRAMWKKGYVSEFLYYWRLPDDLKREALKEILNYDDSGNIIFSRYGNDYILIFLRNQHSFPEDCAMIPDKVIEYFKRNHYDYYDDLDTHIALLKTPLDEKMVSEKSKEIFDSKNMLLKLAANPSISDYMIMQLKVKTPTRYMKDVEEVLEEHRQKRDEYRQANGIPLED